MLPENLLESKSATARALTLEELVEETKRLLGCRLPNAEKIARLKRLLLPPSTEETPTSDSSPLPTTDWKHADDCPIGKKQRRPSPSK